MNIEDLTNEEVFAMAKLSRDLFPENVIEGESLPSFTVTASANSPSLNVEWFQPGACLDTEME